MAIVCCSLAGRGRYSDYPVFLGSRGTGVMVISLSVTMMAVAELPTAEHSAAMIAPTALGSVRRKLRAALWLLGSPLDES